jgi:hypothetical protein
MEHDHHTAGKKFCFNAVKLIERILSGKENHEGAYKLVIIHAAANNTHHP